MDRMDGVMRALAKKNTQWKEDLYFAMKLPRQKLSQLCAEVTPTTGILPISAHILDPFRKLRSFRKWDKHFDIDPEAKTMYTTQYQDAFPRFIKNESCTKHRDLLVIKPERIPSNNHFFSVIASWSGQSSHDPYDLSSDDDKCLMRKSAADMTPRRSDRAAHWLTATTLHLISPPDVPQNRGQLNLNLNHSRTARMETSSTLWIPDITDWWCQQDEIHS